VKSLLLVGTGLIGGSFALAAKAAGIFDRVVGLDRDAAALAEAGRLGIIDAATRSPGTGFDAVCVAVPLGGIAECVRDCVHAAPALFDVGSVKQPVIDALAPQPAHYVPCHPIAGSERHGPAAARRDLFEGQRVVLTPTAATDAAALAAVRGYWEGVGARVEFDTAPGHDDRYALLSHLPHLVAFAFMDAVADAGSPPGAGSGFRDFTRIAAGEADVWGDILHANAPAVRPHLLRLIEHLRTLGEVAEQGGEPLRQRLAAARQRKLALDGDA
jgi:prephenate dehydrogenase